MWKKILGGIVVFIALLIGLVLWATSGLTETASAFFDKVKAHDYKTAYYGYLSDDFKGNVPLDRFKAFIEANRMDRFKEIEWGNRERENGKGKLEGTLVMPDGSTIPIVVEMVKGKESWKIYAISKPAAGLKETGSDGKSSAAKPVVPPKAEVISLARETVAQVAEAIKAKDTAALYRNISDTWKAQISPEKFHEVFSGLMKNGVDLTPLERITPELGKEPSIDEEGLLNVQVVYPVTPAPIYFDLGYLNENGAWKLLKIRLYSKK